MMKRALGAAGVGVLVSCLGALAACGTPSSDENTGSGAAALESANVAITLHDAAGNRIGEGAGVLIAPQLVLTSAHLVAGKARWTVTTADGKKSALGTRGLTYDWMEYNSLKSHPRKHDVAVIYLDKPIQLAAYPKLASAKQASGTAATRVRHDRTAFEMIATKLTTVRTSPHAYAVDVANSETLDTGGAVVNGSGDIVGVVTGRGMTTSKLYIARVDELLTFLTPKVACAGGRASDSISIRTYGAPPPKPGCDGGTGSSSGSSGSSGASGSSSGSSGSSGATGSSSGATGSSSGATGSSGGGGGCDDGGGNCSGDCGGGSGGSSSGNSSGSVGSSSGGASSSGGGASSGSSGNSSGSVGASSSSGGAGGGSGDGEVCEGPNDNPGECPPEPAGCEGAECGGGGPDTTIDYGDCACSSTTPTGAIPPLH